MTCPELELGEFGQRLRDGVGGERYPFSASIELTARCNLDCVHCYINKPMGDVAERDAELTLDEWRDILDQIAELGTFYLLITGGEPLARSDFKDIFSYAKSKGFLITLFTNGTMITPDMADFLADYYPYVVEISLYGATAETYERITGVPGSFARCQRGIELLVERDIPLRLKSVIMTLNHHEYDAIKAFSDSMGLQDFRHDMVVRPRPDGAKSPISLRVTPEQALALDLKDERSSGEWKRLIDETAKGDSEVKTLYPCGAGLRGFHVDPAGQMSLCISAREPSYDLRQGSVRNGWEGFLRELRATPCSAGFICRSCELRSLCGYCPELSRLENGEAESIVDYKCQLAHLRAACVYSK